MAEKTLSHRQKSAKLNAALRAERLPNTLKEWRTMYQNGKCLYSVYMHRFSISLLLSAAQLFTAYYGLKWFRGNTTRGCLYRHYEAEPNGVRVN